MDRVLGPKEMSYGETGRSTAPSRRPARAHGRSAARDSAAGALIAIHGRGAGAEDIIALAREVAPPDVAILAPQAAGNTWYPYRFLEPTERNEPYLSSALRIVADLIAQLG